MEARVWFAEPKSFGKRWIETTGPESFVEGLGALPVVGTEEEAFAARKKKFVPAECRDLGIAAESLVEEKDIRGVFHLHTTWSEGSGG